MGVIPQSDVKFGQGPICPRNIWLVSVEAMAASLPVLTPDWDGLSDAVIHCETGFLVPTMMAGESGIGQDLARSFADGTGGYLQYLMMIERQTVIVMRACVAALSQLGTKSIYVNVWVKRARVMCAVISVGRTSTHNIEVLRMIYCWCCARQSRQRRAWMVPL